MTITDGASKRLYSKGLKISDQKMGSLLSRMTEADEPDVKLTDNQVFAVVEVLIPKMVMTMPGMPPGMRCSVERDDTGWNIRVDRPS